MLDCGEDEISEGGTLDQVSLSFTNPRGERQNTIGNGSQQASMMIAKIIGRRREREKKKL